MTKTPQQRPKMQHKRPMLKSRIEILQGHSKEDLHQKGATAVFRAACSIWSKTLQELIKNPRSNFEPICYWCWLLFGSPNWSTMAPKESTKKSLKNESEVRGPRHLDAMWLWDDGWCFYLAMLLNNLLFFFTFYGFVFWRFADVIPSVLDDILSGKSRKSRSFWWWCQKEWILRVWKVFLRSFGKKRWKKSDFLEKHRNNAIFGRF